MKRVIPLILCLVLVLGLAVTAFADAADNTVTTQVINDTDRTYKAYRIFIGSLIDETILTFTGWDETYVDGEALLNDLKAATSSYHSLFANCHTAGDVASVLLQYPDNNEVARYFANVAVRHIIKENGITISPDEEGNEELLHGYYLLVDQTTEIEGEDPDNFVVNAALLQVTDKAPITLTMKVEAPTHEKNIVSTDDQGKHNHTTVEDYAFGDTVEFHLRAELPPNLRDFDTYRMVFHDVMSDGLSFVDWEDEDEAAPYSIQVNYKRKNAETGALEDATIILDADDYTVLVSTKENPITCTSGKACDVHFVIDNVFDIIPRSEAGDAVFIVSYQAILTDSAQISDHATLNPNTNDYALEFSNDPNWTADPDSSEEEEEEPTGITPWDQVKVYTTEITIHKIDGLTGDDLAGAEFTLKGDGLVNRVKVEGVFFEAYKENETYDAANKYWLLKDGTYTALDPTAENVNTSNYADVNTVYKKLEKDDAILEAAADDPVRAFVNDSGYLTFSGLKEGHYTLIESVVPTGYNKIEDIEVTIIFNEEKSTYTYQWVGGTQNSNNTVTVANYSGSKLPETGGIGTTLFYLIGGLMVAGSAVLLVTKKRMSAE